jgi:hypothetical protein
MRRIIGIGGIGIAVVLVTTIAPFAQSRPNTPTVPELLAVAGKYLTEYDKKFSAVVSEEQYDQTAAQAGFRVPQRRTLKSDVILMNAEAAGWVSLRDVYEVDGSPVRDHTDRILSLLTNPVPDAYAQALRLAQEGARFNLGAVSRTINVPSTALLFLRTDFQKRSTFAFDGMKTIDKIPVAEIAFKEESMPRVIRNPADAAAEGHVWLEPDSGRIIQTELSLKFEKGSSAKITVRYASEPKTNLYVPVRMDEIYVLAAGQTITGRADYRNFRTFAVDVATIIK